MKKFVLLAVLLSALPLGMMAQDDLYFTPSKSEKESKAKAPTYDDDDSPAYYSGSNRNVDEYNRRGKLSSYYQKIGSDSLGNDIIQFHAGNGQYPDSLVLDTIYPGSQQYYANVGDDDDDFAYSRRMNRFDNAYGWYDPYFYSDLYWDYPYYGYGYYPYWRAGWGWYDPWYYGYGWGWRGYYGWYGPGYWGGYWGDPWWGPGYAWRGGHTGTHGHSFGNGTPGPRGDYGPGRFNNGNNGRTNYGSFGNGRSRGTFGNGGSTRSWGNTTAGTIERNSGGWRGSQPYNPGNNTFNGTRSYSPQSTGSRSFGSAPSRSFGGGSFGGGSRSFGGGGGGRSFGGGGGGHFGGGRR